MSDDNESPSMNPDGKESSPTEAEEAVVDEGAHEAAEPVFDGANAGPTDGPTDEPLSSDVGMDPSTSVPMETTESELTNDAPPETEASEKGEEPAEGSEVPPSEEATGANEGGVTDAADAADALLTEVLGGEQEEAPTSTAPTAPPVRNRLNSSPSG
eukprot:1188953-Prorocentrum_minimum.AAC.2